MTEHGEAYGEHHSASFVTYVHSPIHLMVLIAMLGAALTGVSLFYSIHQPWLGLSFIESDVKGLMVADVDPDGPSATIIASGDALQSIRGVRSPWMSLDKNLLIEDPDILSLFSERRKLQKREQALYQAMRDPVVHIRLGDGREVRIQPGEIRPLSTLSFSFLVLNMIAFFALMIGAGVCSVRMDSLPARLLLFSGAGFTIAASSAAVYIYRELAINPEQFHFFTAFNHLGIFIYIASGLGLLWHYPRSLKSWPMTRIMVVFVALVWMNEQGQWVELPFHSYFFPVALLFLFAAGFGIAQWRKSHHRPVDRAAIKWVLLSIFFSVSAIMVLYFIPGMLIHRSILPIVWSFAAALILYLGFVFGVIRYRLFDIERWWLNIWLWFAAGLTVVASDAAIGLLLPQVDSYALPLAVLFVGWCYFPVRQWVWHHLFGYSHREIGQFLPTLVLGLVKCDRDDSEKWWMEILQETFHPMHLSRIPALDDVRLQDYGGKMLIPSIHGRDAFELCYAEQGRRLFVPEDARIVKSLIEIARRTEQQLHSYARGMNEERRRIMRDLHDEVGGQLLTLVHQLETERATKLASSALTALREVIYSMDEKDPVDYEMAFSRWRIQVSERCESSGIEWCWQGADNLKQGLLTNRQYYNINLAFKESLTNALKHPGTSKIFVSMDISNGYFLSEIKNNLGKQISETLQLGKGLHNMQSRIHEIGGKLDYQIKKKAFIVTFLVPLGDANTGG